ncbi:MAG: hypothetical protein K2Q20_02460, partial [Phycisphaerales bacterium]|nr:hypothetical protein [Phycisphaerales bacterium]
GVVLLLASFPRWRDGYRFIDYDGLFSRQASTAGEGVVWGLASAGLGALLLAVRVVLAVSERRRRLQCPARPR